MPSPSATEPRPGSRPPGDAGSLALLAALVRDGAAHLSGLVQLARTEVRGNLRAAAGLATLFGTALLLVPVALALFVEAVVKALGVLIGSEIAAAAILAAPFLAAAILLVVVARRRFLQVR